MPRLKKELVGHLLEFEYFIEKASNIIIAGTLLLLLIIIPGWIVTIQNYALNPTYGLRGIGLSLLVSVLLGIGIFIAFLVPHFEPELRPHSFRVIKDRRMRTIYLVLISSLLSFIILIYILMGITTLI